MKTGFFIALAWPATLCKRPGSWYDGIANAIGLSQNHYYKVGHAALVLVEKSDGNLHYFDFGRYHTPFGLGRIRNAETDHDLALQSKAQIESNAIVNLDQILSELLNNPSCHGEGDLHASYTEMDFEKAYRFTKTWQAKSPIPYGPFIKHGTNCSRFVRKVAVKSGMSPQLTLKLRLPKTVSPTPLNNVKALPNYTILSKAAEVEKIITQLA